MKTIFEDEYRDVISRLKKARLAKGLSQKGLSESLKCSQSYISKVEQGQIRLDVIQLKKFTHALGIKIEDVLK